jgi:hypothetical protein
LEREGSERLARPGCEASIVREPSQINVDELVKQPGVLMARRLNPDGRVTEHKETFSIRHFQRG